MQVPTVSNMSSPRSGSPVANQFIITDGAREVFQSYSTPIAYKEGATFYISSDWNYSVTTSKYFYEWLRTFGLGYDLVEIKNFLKKAEKGDTYDELPSVTIKYLGEEL